MPANSLQAIAFNRFLSESGGGQSGPIIPETAKQLFEKAGLDSSNVDSGTLDVVDRTATNQSVSNLRKHPNEGTRQINIVNAIRVGSGEQPRRAIFAAPQILGKSALAYTLKQAVSENVSPENAKLALTQAGQAHLATDLVAQIFYKAMSHPNEDVQIHAIALLGDALPGEGSAIGARQRALIKGASSSFVGVRNKVLEMLPTLLPSDESKQSVLRTLEATQGHSVLTSPHS